MVTCFLEFWVPKSKTWFLFNFASDTCLNLYFLDDTQLVKLSEFSSNITSFVSFFFLVLALVMSLNQL